MLWSNKITEKITVLNEGSHRISAVTLSDDILDFNLYCVYMPCQNYSMDLFESTLDELGEIMTKYSNSTTIILGDMNASVNRSKGYRQDKALKSFLNEKHLSVPKDYPEEHTYYHHGGKQSSQIDYIVISSTQIDKISDIKVMIDEPLNTSSHRTLWNAHSGDNATFYKIIRRQRQSGKRLLDCLIIDDVHFDTPDLIREAWTNYFTDLSTPSEKPQNQQYRSQVELDRILLQDILEHEDEKTIEFDIGTIQKCISKMKTGKATDQFGISAEHFKYGETEEYNISKEKTKVMIWNSSLNCNLWNQMEKFHIGSETLETVENYKHIGIDRDSREVEATRTIIGNRSKNCKTDFIRTYGLRTTWFKWT
ncbi:Hypothetical predicted protein [Mytilus galloprovincialis]|uniref:Endonuclease/exonuclease/phosphatase domain-containing protein n=1 Tax=Mytilus galloprovincialis TaxID=29158 RepID=A0A8B6HPH6_MYTGA|nr:Hypothetical predicted protein [Mytilus galloprovincialis]